MMNSVIVPFPGRPEHFTEGDWAWLNEHATEFMLERFGPGPFVLWHIENVPANDPLGPDQVCELRTLNKDIERVSGYFLTRQRPPGRRIA